MRFKEFVLEELTSDFDVELFLKNCAPFLSEIKGLNHKLLPKHGSRRAADDWVIKKHEPRAAPRDSHEKLHLAIDTLLTKKFNWPARSDALFVSGDYDTARSYGPVSLIFPIGAYQYVWSPQFFDLYDEYEKIFHNLNRSQTRSIEQWELNAARARAETVRLAKRAEWHFNSELNTALSKGREVMLKAESYYEIRWGTEQAYDTVLAVLMDRKIIF